MACNQPDQSMGQSMDLAMTEPDLSSSDLSMSDQQAAVAYDLAWSSCAGTQLAGTCVADFFDSFAACFHPVGHCTAGTHNFGMIDDWENGAEYLTSMPSLNVFAGNWKMGMTQCLSVHLYSDGRFRHFCTPADAVCSDVGRDAGVDYQGGALFDTQTGVFTCRDGTQVNVGADLDGCALLNELLAPHPLCDGLR
jgi:hypothetical protein